MADEPAGGIPESVEDAICDFDAAVEMLSRHASSSPHFKAAAENHIACAKRLCTAITAALAAAERRGIEKAAAICEDRSHNYAMVMQCDGFATWRDCKREEAKECAESIRALPAAPPPERTTP